MVRQAEATIDISDPKSYVSYIAMLHAKNLRGRTDIVSPAMLIANHGRVYEPSFARCGRGEIKQCYNNAADLAIADLSLTYVEGWATSDVGLAVEHAWCVNKRGRVVEPTWRGDGMPKGIAYYGIPVPTNVLTKVLVATKSSGVFAQWFNWNIIEPLLRREMPELFGGKNGRQK